MHAVAPLQQVLRAAIAVAGAVTALAGCGGAGDEDAPAATPPRPRMTALLDRVPAGANLIAALDLGAARRELGLPVDLAPAAAGGTRLDAAHRRFNEAALTPLRYLGLPDLPAAARAIDHRVTGVVDAQIDHPDGDLDARLADERRLLDGVRGAFRVVFADLPPRVAPCVRAVAGGQRFDAHGDEDLVLTLGAAPDPERILLGQGPRRASPATRDYSVRAATVEGRVLRMRIDLADGAAPRSSAARLVVGEAGTDQLYRCP